MEKGEGTGVPRSGGGTHAHPAQLALGVPLPEGKGWVGSRRGTDCWMAVGRGSGVVGGVCAHSEGV